MATTHSKEDLLLRASTINEQRITVSSVSSDHLDNMNYLEHPSPSLSNTAPHTALFSHSASSMSSRQSPTYSCPSSDPNNSLYESIYQKDSNNSQSTIIVPFDQDIYVKDHITTPTVTTPPKTSKLIHYDGLRGVAAIWVFFLHYLVGPTPELYSFLLAGQIWCASVPIFFILSGRVLTVSILKSGNMRQLASAIIRRPFRLLVPMLSMAFIDMLFLHRNQPTFVLKIVLDHLWFMFDGAEIPSTGTWVEWTLSNEYSFSNVIFFASFVLLQFRDNGKARYLILGSMIFWFQLTHSWGTHFIAGLLLADLAQNGYMDRYRSWKYSHYINTLWFIGSACLVFRSPILNIADPVDQAVRAHLYSHGNMGVNMHYSVENAMIFLFCFSIMLSIETSVWLQWVFSRSPLVFLGRISFPLYLMHPYAAKYLDMVNNYLREVIKNYVLLTACIFVVSTAIVCLCSYLLIPVIDTPSIYIGRWVEQSVVTEPWSWTAIKLWAIGLPQKIKADIKKRLRSLHTSVRGVVHAVQHPKLCRSH